MKSGKTPNTGVTLIVTVLISFLFILNSCGESTSGRPQCYIIDNDTGGCVEKVKNIRNLSVVSNDTNHYKAEYEAGFIQGKLQKTQILMTRDNFWDMAYLLDPSHSFPKQIPPSPGELSEARRVLQENFTYTLDYIRNQKDPVLLKNMRRLLYRMIGIYHGTKMGEPVSIPFDDTWLPSFSQSEMTLGYETRHLTFMDIYFINGFSDAWDVIASLVDAPLHHQPDKCSAFVKKTSDDIYITHNSWFGFLSQSMAVTLYINGDYLSMNAISPGCIGSASDFGYNNKGILFNETTHHAGYSEPKSNALWMFWRATLAEQFADSLDSFFEYISLEPSGTYMNGYMVVDSLKREIGLIEMSYQSFVYFRPNGENGYSVITKPEGRSTEYDHDLVQPDYLLGINYPASQLIRDELQALDTRPARKRQFMAMIGDVKDIESAKSLITYTDPENPLSIYGRWDLGYGETPTPKTVPDGSIDAKAASASMIAYVSNLKGILDLDSNKKAFWMKFGTPYVNGKPFIWSESQWNGQKLRGVPDRVDGDYVLLNTYIR